MTEEYQFTLVKTTDSISSLPKTLNENMDKIDEAIHAFAETTGASYTLTTQDKEDIASLVPAGDKGADGTDYILTDRDKEEIASLVEITGSGDLVSFDTLTEEQITLLKGQDGADGLDGQDGADGLDGQDGADGLDGQDGADGLDGQDGADGADGLDGKDFTYDMFTPEQLELLKGRDGVDGSDGQDGTDGTSIVSAEIIDNELVLALSDGTSLAPVFLSLNDTDKRLVELAVQGLTDKQDRLIALTEEAVSIKDSDTFFVKQDGNIKILTALLMAEYVVANSPIPPVGKTLDDYTKEELWAIFEYGQGENYFEIGDKMTWVSNRLVTTAQIADFNKDVMDETTGQRANVTFILNDYVTANGEEIYSKAFEYAKTDFVPYDCACLASVIELQENGGITGDLLPDNMVGLLTHVYKKNYGQGWSDLEHPSARVYFFPLGSTEVYAGQSGTDQYTGETEHLHYALFSSASDNLSCLYTYKEKVNLFLRYCTSAATGGMRELNTSGLVEISKSTMVSTTEVANRFPVGFCMGKGTV